MASKTQKGKNNKTKENNTKVNKTTPAAKADKNPGGFTVYPEVKLLLMFALCLFLMLCNFHLCSGLGNGFFWLMHGCFGAMAYLFPVGLFLGYSFLLSNSGRKDATQKFLLGLLIFWNLCSIVELFGISNKTAYNPVIYFKAGQSGFNGGLFGGIIGGGLKHLVGSIAAFLLLAILLLILCILITERSISYAVLKVLNQLKSAAGDMKQSRIAQRQAEEEDYIDMEASGGDSNEKSDPVYAYSDQSQEENTDYPSYQEDTFDPYGSPSAAAYTEPVFTTFTDKGAEEEEPAYRTVSEDTDTEKQDTLPYEDAPFQEVPSPDRSSGKKLFSVSLFDNKGKEKEESHSSRLNNLLNTKLPFRKEKKEVQKEAPVRAGNTDGAENPDGLNGRMLAGHTRMPHLQEPLSLEELGLESMIAELDEGQNPGSLYTIDDFILYNGIREWHEDDPFVMPLMNQPEEVFAGSDQGKGPVLIKNPEAEVLSASSWQNSHEEAEQEEYTGSVYQIYDQSRERDSVMYQDTEEEDTAESDVSVTDIRSISADPDEDAGEYDNDEAEMSGAETADTPFAFPDGEDFAAAKERREEAVDLTENVVLPEGDFAVRKPSRRMKDTESIWRTQDDFSNRSDSGAVTFSKPKKPEPVKKIKKAYVKAPLNLLSSNGEFRLGIDKHHIEIQKKLYNTLESFGVHVKMGAISVGPAVTRYELEPEVGVKVSRIVGLQDDIKLALAAADVRIEAPIPGKSAVGIEVPNAKSTTVGFRELIDTEKFRTHPSKLCVAIGRDLSGQIQLADLAKMPHLLIAGATGSGKSVCINTLIMSILYKATPDEVKMIMVDPKVVELSSYNGIPHLLIPVVTDPRKASNALRWAVDEMDDRYKRLAELKVRNIQGYNEEIRKRKKEDPAYEGELMYQMVIIVDELADLMMVAPGEVEESICRLAQKARAAGIHLVLATQRPSVNVITGLIKANVPSRIAFAVSSGVDSRTILDMNGAEKLLGRGDMLYYPYGLQKPIRVQGAFISDEDVAKVVEYIVSHNMDSKSGAEQMEDMITSAAQTPELKPVTDGRDEHFAEAARFIIESDKASIGALQRKFRIGFNRAARLMDALADEGIVGEEEGTKPRKILMNMEELENYLSSEP